MIVLPGPGLVVIAAGLAAPRAGVPWARHTLALMGRKLAQAQAGHRSQGRIARTARSRWAAGGRDRRCRVRGHHRGHRVPRRPHRPLGPRLGRLTTSGAPEARRQVSNRRRPGGRSASPTAAGRRGSGTHRPTDSGPTRLDLAELLRVLHDLRRAGRHHAPAALALEVHMVDFDAEALTARQRPELAVRRGAEDHGVVMDCVVDGHQMRTVRAAHGDAADHSPGSSSRQLSTSSSRGSFMTRSSAPPPVEDEAWVPRDRDHGPLFPVRRRSARARLPTCPRRRRRAEAGSELLDRLAMAAFAVDHLGRITYVNEAAVAMLGSGPETAIGSDVRSGHLLRADAGRSRRGSPARALVGVLGR